MTRRHIEIYGLSDVRPGRALAFAGRGATLGAQGLLQGNLGFGIMFQKHSERHTHSIFARSAVSLAAVTDANNLNRIVAPSK